ncbi:MAG: hypothetical protein KAR38_02580, partial [Calditrichia bacterium]|nr:hypothetical protein [Calditrichia bacterium]
MLKEKILDSIDFTVEKFVYPHLRKRYSHVNYVPNFIKIETTNLCNSMCLYCPHKTLKREQGFMDETLFRKIISEVYDLDIPEVHLSNFGEPLL